MKIGDRVAHPISRLLYFDDNGYSRFKRRGTIVDRYVSVFDTSHPMWWVQWDNDLRLAYREAHLILADEVHLDVI